MNDEPLVRETPNPEAGWQYITTIINCEKLNIDFSIPEKARRIMKAEKEKAAERLRRAKREMMRK